MKYEEDLPRTYPGPSVLWATVGFMSFMICSGLFIFLMYRAPHLQAYPQPVIKDMTER